MSAAASETGVQLDPATAEFIVDVVSISIGARDAHGLQSVGKAKC